MYITQWYEFSQKKTKDNNKQDVETIYLFQ
jgi:hypothetical protein